MYREIEQKLFRTEPFMHARELLQQRHSLITAGLAGSSLGFFAKFLVDELKFRQIVLVTPNSRQGEQIWNDLSHLFGEKRVFYFPTKFEGHDFTQRIHSETVGQQLKTLDFLIENKQGLIILPVQALKESFTESSVLRQQRLQLAEGIEISLEEVARRLVDFKYERVDLVGGVGEFCVRGGLIDVFPFESVEPVRVEFFSDFIETIRHFNVITQRSTDKIDSITLLPPLIQNQDGDKESRSIFDFFDPGALFFLDEPEIYEKEIPDAVQIYGLQNSDIVDEVQEPSAEIQAIQKNISNFQFIEHRHVGQLQHVDVHFRMTTNEDFRGNIRQLRKKIEQFLNARKRGFDSVHILLEEKYEVERLSELIQNHEPESRIMIGQGALHSGFVFPAAGLMVITEKDLYGRIPKKRNLGKYRGGIPISKLNALMPGEIMVHVDHGIGRYVGLAKIQVAGSEQECLKLEYRDRDFLYVNIDHLQRVNRYKGAEGVVPQLNRLGGKDWSRLKEKTQKAIAEMAKDILELYAIRKSEKGHSFSRDHEWQKELEATFLYDETIDQLRTIEEVKRDMEADTVMDRLVCGDVGFGKTEVALRAAFKAVLDGKQAAILVPTTVLAQQHYDTFTERLTNYPMQIALLSRFKSKGQQKKIVQDLKVGKVDIVIGTHRLLSNDVKFKDLGLLIVDEEHRFGVRQKEKIKNQFKLVDVLSLTATPIPRTLHLALMGSRDMSTINTPPKDRLPVITEVAPFDKNLIRRAILDEVLRGGQIFVVHNRVRSIASMAKMIQRLVPDIRIAVAHGRMHPHDLEKIMLDFVRKKYDCLVSTMIIESGLDMPNVNTLIVNRADKLGLAQLYQLKGRVGRSNRQAYAYFLAPAFKFLTDNALKRLQTIEEHLELGAGLQIALKDLEIRGAGNLLGKQQSGFINAIGFDLYCKLLDETIANMKGEKPAKDDATTRKIDVVIESEFAAYIPEDYIEMDYERVNIYQKLTNVASENELAEIEEELRDRFGVLPKPARVLIEITRLKILAGFLGIDKLRIKQGELTAYFSDAYFANSNQELLQKRIRSIQESSPELLRFLHGKKFGFKFRLRQADETSLHFTKDFFNQLLRKAA